MEKNKEQKKILLIILVISITVLIFLAWIINLQHRIKNIENLEIVPQNQELSELKQDFNQAIDKMNESLTETKTEGLTDEIKEEIKNEIKEELLINEDIEIVNEEVVDNNNIDVPIEFVSPNPSCPAYVNCMPSFGPGAGSSCYVPPACEGITQMVW